MEKINHKTSLNHEQRSELKRIRLNCLNSKDPLRFIQYSMDEKAYLIEINRKPKSKKTLKEGDQVVFSSGNYAGLTGVVTNIDWKSKHPNAIFGFYHTVLLSNGKEGHIEKSDHWDFV
jgi:transcription antitermination factor NusG